MSAVSSTNSEPLVLARRGLRFAATARLSAPAPWFASFALARLHVPLRPGVQPVPGAERPSAVPNDTEVDPYENLVGGDDPWADTETALRRGFVQSPASMAGAGERPSEISTRVELKAPAGFVASFPTHSARPDDILAQRAQAVVGARPAEVAWSDPPSAQAASRMRRTTERPSLDQPSREASPAAGLFDSGARMNGYSRAPLGGTPPMQTSPGVGLDDASSKRPPPVELPVSEPDALRTTPMPVAADLSVRRAPATGNVPVQQPDISRPVAAPAQGFASGRHSPPSEGRTPTSFATPMGTAHAAPRSDSSAAAARTEIAQLAERTRATFAANAGGRASHRIGTVQVVVRTAAPAHDARQTAAVPAPMAAAKTPPRHAFRSPWVSSRRRGD